MLETTVDLSRLDSTALEVLTDPHLLQAFRYIAAPPISADDLKVLADATLSKDQWILQMQFVNPTHERQHRIGNGSWVVVRR
ncbi:MAG: XamI family restriction endonuclease [Nitrospira sp.]|nr:XamI family restriction endonuclease [Nitrospira sp.]